MPSNDFEKLVSPQFLPSNLTMIRGSTLLATDGMLHTYHEEGFDWQRIHRSAKRQDSSIPAYGKVPGGPDLQYWSESGLPMSVLAFCGEATRKQIAADVSTNSMHLEMMSADPSLAVRKAVIANASSTEEARKLAREMTVASSGKSHTSSSEGCYIATAVYGSYDAPQVITLRQFRDESLSTSMVGRAFVRIYYRVSPKLVRTFGGNGFLSSATKKALDSFVTRLESKK